MAVRAPEDGGLTVSLRVASHAPAQADLEIGAPVNQCPSVFIRG